MKNLMEDSTTFLPIASTDVNIRPSPISSNLSNRKKRIDCVGNDLSEIQYNEEDINSYAPEASLVDKPNTFTEELRNPLQAKRLAKIKDRNNKAKKHIHNNPNPQTSLEEVVSILQEEKITPSLPVQIKVDEMEFTVTVNIPDQETPLSSTWGPFPETRDDLVQILRDDSFKILKIIAKKNNPRCDTRRAFNPYEENLLPVKLSVKKKSISQVNELAEDTDDHLLSNPADESNPEDDTDVNVKGTDSSPPSPSQLITLTEEVKLLPKIEPFEESVKTECFVDDVETSNSYIKPISQKSPCNKNLRRSEKLGIRFRRSKSLPSNIGKDVSNEEIDDIFIGFTTEDQSRSKYTILIEQYNKIISKFTEKNVDENSKNEKIGTRITRSKSLCCVNSENTGVPKQVLLKENGNILQNFEVSQNPLVSGSHRSALDFPITVDEDNDSTNSASFEDEQENYFTCKEENIDTGENVTEKLVFINDTTKGLCYSSEDLSIPEVISDPLDMSSSMGSDRDNDDEDDILRDDSSVQSFPESQTQSIYNEYPQESSHIDDPYISFKLFCDDSDHSDEYDKNKTYLESTEEVLMKYREKLKQSADSNDMNEKIGQANNNKTGRPLTLYEKSQNIHKIYGKKKSIDESLETNIDTKTIDSARDLVNFSLLDGPDMSENRGIKSLSYGCDFSTNDGDPLLCPESQIFINNKNDFDTIDDEEYKKDLETKLYIKSPDHQNRDPGDFYKRFSTDYSKECSTPVSHKLGYSETSVASQINTLDVTSIVEAKQEENRTRTRSSLNVSKNKNKNTDKTSGTAILFSNYEMKESRVMTRKRRFSESLMDIMMNQGVNTTKLLNEPLEQSTNNQPKKRGRPKKSISTEGRLSVSSNEISQEIPEVDISNKSVPEEELSSVSVSKKRGSKNSFIETHNTSVSSFETSFSLRDQQNTELEDNPNDILNNQFETEVQGEVNSENKQGRSNECIFKKCYQSPKFNDLKKPSFPSVRINTQENTLNNLEIELQKEFQGNVNSNVGPMKLGRRKSSLFNDSDLLDNRSNSFEEILPHLPKKPEENISVVAISNMTPEFLIEKQKNITLNPKGHGVQETILDPKLAKNTENHFQTEGHIDTNYLLSYTIAGRTKKSIPHETNRCSLVRFTSDLGTSKKSIFNVNEQSDLVGSPSPLDNGIFQEKTSEESEATTACEKKFIKKNTVEVNTIEGPKKRGRPKKSISNDGEQSEYTSTFVGSPTSLENGISRDKTSVETEATTAHENMFKKENALKVPKRRGRSKKSISNKFEQSEHTSSLVGSPSSLENEISQGKTSVVTKATTAHENKFKMEKTVEVNTIETLRKRGRPKKSISNEGEESEIRSTLVGSPSSLENGISQEKTSVGTKATTAHENKFKMENIVEANTNEEPKRRGRPKKSISNEGEESEIRSTLVGSPSSLENGISQEKTSVGTKATTAHENKFKMEKTVEVNTNEEPKRRGRPKKSISNEDEKSEIRSTFVGSTSSLVNKISQKKISVETEGTTAQTSDNQPPHYVTEDAKVLLEPNKFDGVNYLISNENEQKETTLEVIWNDKQSAVNVLQTAIEVDAGTRSEHKKRSLKNLLQTELQIGVNSIVGPKKRGRPKKSLPNQIDLLSPGKTLVEANCSVMLDNENPDIKTVTSISVRKELGKPMTNISGECNQSNNSTSESKDESLLDTSGIVMSENLLQTELQIGVNSIVGPKKRGRPKKSLPNQIDLLSPGKALVEANCSVTLDNENPDIKTVTSISVPKELGKPMTNIYGECNQSNNSTSESKDESLLDTSGIVMSENLLQTELQIGVNSIVGPKKRGRPKKSLPNQIDLLSPGKALVEANCSVTLDNENPDIKTVTSISVPKELGKPMTNISGECNQSNNSTSESKDESLLDTSGIVMSENRLQTELQIGVNSIVGPKKRGRPKKSLPNQIDLLSPGKALVEANCSVTLDNENPDIKTVTSISVPKELGKPMTNISGECNQSNNSTSESKDESLLDTSGIVMSENRLQTELQIGVNSTVGPKKRGRPKKSISIESHAVISCSFESSKSSPLHDNPMDKTSINFDCFSTDTKTQVDIKSVSLPRKRGRPKRVDLTAESSSVNTFSVNSNISVEDEHYTLTKKQRPLRDIVEPSTPADNLGRSSALITPSQSKEYSITEDNFPDEGFTPVPKKRGRPRERLRAYSTINSRRQVFTQEFDVSSDEEYLANKSCRRSLNTGSDFEHSQEELMKEVKCAICGEDMTLHTYKYEHLIKHNFMSWIEGEEPLPLDDENYMVNLLNRGKRQIPGFVFTCELCNETRKSAKGFLTHKQCCGKTDNDTDLNSSVLATSGSSRDQTKMENVKCAICEESMTALQFRKSHLLKHNFMAWMEGEDPLPLKNVDYMANVLTRGKRCFPKFKLTCELCKKTRKSVRGFLVHYQKCGKKGMPADDFETSGYDIDLDEEDLSNPIEDSHRSPGNLNSSQKMWKTSDLKNFLDNPEAYSSQKPPTDEFGTPLTARQIRMRILTGRIDCSTRLKYPHGEVTCAICGETMTARVYQRVHLIKHNFICWLIDEEPLPLDDVEIMTNVLQRGKKKYPRISFTCEVCKEAKRSAHGFLSHRQFCGRSEEEKQNILQTCKYCGRMMMPFSLLQHMKQAHRDDPVIEPASVVDEPSVRKAAVKCLDKIADYVSSKQGSDMSIIDEEMDEDEYLGDKKELRAFYILAPRKPGKNLNILWRKQEEIGEVLQCSSSKCPFSCKTIREMNAHFRECLHIFSSFSCKKCNYMNRSEEDMMKHVRDHCYDESWSSEDDSHDVTVIPYLKVEENELLNKRKLHFFEPAVNWTKNAYEANLSEEGLFPEFEASWEIVTSSDSRHFLPEEKTSIPLRYNSTNWTLMNTFDGNILEGQKEGIGFAGGPIWGLAWCPSDGPQYLAVANQHSMETHFQLGSTYTGPGLIQIWGLGDINNSENGKLERLEYTFGICHEERGCWDLAWCPGGGQTASRLGLLAVATTSGTIPIYSVPQPGTLPLEENRYYKLKPAIKLELPSNEKWQCSAISWSKKKPHQIFVAGFVNGVIAVWNLQSTSSLLKTTPGSLCSHKVFQAHTSFITGICLSPENEEFLASSSYDRSVKFWDLRDTTVPQSETNRGLATGIDWLRHWMMAATSFDAAYTMSNSTLGLSTIRGFMYQSAPIVSNVDSTCWDVGCNDWLNALAGVYDNGQLFVSFATKHLLQHKEKKKCSKVILQCSLHEVSPKEQAVGGCSATTSRPSEASSTQYDQSAKKYGMEIKTDLKVQSFIKNDLTENTEEGPIDIYPLTSLNRVSWSPNRQSFTYIASGCQSGFLVVTKLSFPFSEQFVIDSAS